MDSLFVNLHMASSHSAHFGSSSSESIIEWAEKFEHDAIALTDRDSLAGVVPFSKGAKDAGIKPIIGCELTENASPQTKSSRSVVLLARNRRGYEFISRTITKRHLDENFNFIEVLSEVDENVVLLVADPGLLVEISGRQDVRSTNDRIVFAEIAASDDERILERNHRLARVADSLGIETVLTPTAYGVDPSRWETHRVLRAIDLLSSVNRLKKSQFMPKDCCLKTENELSRWRKRFPGAIERTREIADMCDYSPTFEKWVFPEYPVPTGETDHGYLSRIAHEGLRRRMGKPSAMARRRLRFELSVIKRLGFSSYFLAVWEIVHLTRQRNIPCIGRGSAANSLVSYCLWLTHVDPIKSDLFFERFLNPWRSSPPDIDIDFSWKRRDEIIEWIYERYGRDRVAMISTHVTFRMRSAIRETAKAYGIPDQEALSVTDKIPWGWDGTLSKLKEHHRNINDFPFDQKIWQRVLKVAGSIQGFPQHHSIHCGGIVITPDPITNHLPLQKSGQTGKGLAVTQFEMHAVESIGLIKIDLLGNRSLGVFTDVMDTLKQKGITPDIENQNMVFNDPRTIEIIRTGQTMGCFYIESPAMRNLLQKLHVVTFEGLTAASSVIRPGVAESGMMDEYIKRHNDPSLVSYLHPKLEEILHLTYGVMIYQEDVIRVVHHVAGMSLAEADLLRRAMSGKSRGRKSMRQLEDDFVRTCIDRGMEPDIAIELWRQIVSFAGYAFCKGHSASFAILSFQMTYLKSRFPALFMAGVMSNFGGFYGLSAYIQEARRLGVEILAPDINFSVYLHVAEEPVAGNLINEKPGYSSLKQDKGLKPLVFKENDHQRIRLGLCLVKSLEQKTIERITIEREKDGQYESLFDFVRRTSITPSQLRILIECGGLDSIGESRPKLLMQSEVYMGQQKKPALNETSGDLFPSHDPAPSIAKRTDFDIHKRIKMELKHFGRIVTCHPLEYFKSEVEKVKPVSSSDMKRFSGKRVRMVGWMIAHKTIRTRKSGKLMKFLSMEDLGGTYEVTMFPQTYEKFGWKTDSHGPYVATGRIEDHHRVPALNCESIELLVDFVEAMGKIAKVKGSDNRRHDAKPPSYDVRGSEQWTTL